MNDRTETIRTLTGKVTSAKMDKTVTVLVERVVKHAVYGKFVRKSTKLHAHDQDNQCGEDDLVVITASRPLSKTKSWTVKKVLEKAR